ncbi:LysR family transcriptional regulator (fragment) [Pseudomonas sp. 9Ag]
MNNLQRGPRKSLSPLFNVPGPDVSAGLVFSDEIHAISAAIGAQGLALMNRQLIEDEVRAGRLMQPFGPEMGGKPFHLVYPGKPSG